MQELNLQLFIYSFSFIIYILFSHHVYLFIIDLYRKITYIYIVYIKQEIKNVQPYIYIVYVCVCVCMDMTRDKNEISLIILYKKKMGVYIIKNDNTESHTD